MTIDSRRADAPPAEQQRRRRIGVMGGTFDPIHHGHLVAASEVATSFDLDEVVFVPTGRPWHKAPVTPAEHRYLMTVIATASNPRFTVSRVDIDRGGVTYTIDTCATCRPRIRMPTSSSSRGPPRSRRSSTGKTSTSCGNSPISWRSHGPVTPSPFRLYRART